MKGIITSHQNFRQDIEAMAEELIHSLKSHRSAELKDVSQVTSSNMMVSNRMKTSMSCQTSILNISKDGNEKSVAEITSSGAEPPQPLETLLSSMQLGIYSASEASVVLMNTVFNGALADPKSAQIIMEQEGFVDFITSENEIDALRRASTLFSSAASSISKYLEVLKGAQLYFPEKTNFAHKSTQILNMPVESIGSVHEKKCLSLKSQSPYVNFCFVHFVKYS